jgi:hypothetical protein
MVPIDSPRSCVGVRHSARTALSAGLSITLLVTANRGLAQEGPVPAPEYDAEVGAALEDHEAGRFEAARVHFRRAHDVFPNARTLRGLGKVEFELHNYVEAVKLLEAALRCEVRPLPAELRDEVSALVERARANVAELQVEVRPEGAQIVLDGVRLADGAHARLLLPAGPHLLELSARGRVTERRQLDVGAREKLQLAIELRALEAPAPVQAASPYARADEPQAAWRKWWVWTVGGIALAGVATTAVLLATRERDEDERPALPDPTLTLKNP